MPKSIHRPEHLLLAKLLRDRRLSVGMSQAELSRKLDRPQSFVSDVEASKRRLDLVLVEDICKAMGSTLSDLVASYEAARRRSAQSKT